MINLLKELNNRTFLHNYTEINQEENLVGYVGFDPTAESLHIGNLAAIQLLKYLQVYNYTPIALIGGASGMIGDPSGKSKERNFLNREKIIYNEECLKEQLNNLIPGVKIVNNKEWFEDMNVVEFLRDCGKHLTINYMMAKDSVKNRINRQEDDNGSHGISYTEFSYQLIQAWDFYYLNKEYNCNLQMGGSDQWGNMMSGIDLIKKKNGNTVYALTCPLLQKQDGTKFGKSEKGENIWLSPNHTTPYEFYQYWINLSDDDAKRMIRIFTFLDDFTINDEIYYHDKSPSKRKLQTRLADEVTRSIHGEAGLEEAKNATRVLFSKNTSMIDFKAMGENTFKQSFDSVPKVRIEKHSFEESNDIPELVSEKTNGSIFSSKGEARKMIKNNGLSINKTKVHPKMALSEIELLYNKFILIQKGKKNYFLIEIV